MKKFNEALDDITEGYGFHKTVVRERYPSKLKLSDNFVAAFKEEFEKQTSPIYTEDEVGDSTMTQDARDPKRVLKEFQKALKFLI